MSRLSAACSRMLAHQPITRLDANVGVNSSRRQAAAVHHDAGVELDVGVELAAGLELGEHLDAVASTCLASSILSPPSRSATSRSMHRARVVGLVDAVAEAHEPVAALDRVAQPRLGVVGGADRVEHVERAARRAAVQRARQRADAPTTAAPRSAPVDVMTRAVNVDALKPWSIVEMRYCSTRGRVLGGRAPRRCIM